MLGSREAEPVVAFVLGRLALAVHTGLVISLAVIVGRGDGMLGVEIDRSLVWVSCRLFRTSPGKKDLGKNQSKMDSWRLL